MEAAAGADPTFSMEQEYSVLDPFTGLPPGVFPGAVPIYTPGTAPAAAPQPLPGASSHCDSGAAWGGSSGSPGGAPDHNSLAGSLAGLPSATAARLLLAGAPPAHPHGSPAARRARALMELHMAACLKAGLRYAGAAPLGAYAAAGAGGGDAYAYKIGPCAGVELGDQISVSRFLLQRLSDEMGLPLSFDPPPGGGGAGGLACALEFSTAATRSAACDALSEMQRMLSRLQGAHAYHAAGRAGGPAPPGVPLPPPAPFTVAIGDRRAAISIPSSTLACRAGPFVDRRAAASCDPYLAPALLASAALGLPLPPSAERALAAKRAPHKPRNAALPFAASGAAIASLLLKQHAAATAAAAAAKGPTGGLAAALAAYAGSVCSPPRGAPPSFGSAADDDDEDSLGGAGFPCSEEGEESDLESSRDLLISEIRRIDRAARRACKPRAACSAAAGGWRPAAALPSSSSSEEESEDFEGEEEDSACSALASAASSPECGGPLAAACCAGEAMRMA
jgi:hypothetical protein